MKEISEIEKVKVKKKKGEAEKEEKKGQETESTTQFHQPEATKTLVQHLKTEIKPESRKISEEKVATPKITTPKLNTKTFDSNKGKSSSEQKNMALIPPSIPKIKLKVIEFKKSRSVSKEPKDFSVPKVKTAFEIKPEDKEVKISMSSVQSMPKLPKVESKNYELHPLDLKVYVPKIPKEIKPEEKKESEVESKERAKFREIEGRDYGEISDFLDFILGKGAGELLSGKPLCIILPKDFEDYGRLIAGICREIYKEKRGKLPKPINETEIGELEKFFADVESQIVVVKNVKVRDANFSNIKSFLEGFYAKGLGYLILVSDDPLSLENSIKRISMDLDKKYVIRLGPRKLDSKKKENLLSFISGMEKKLKEGEIEIEFPFGQMLLQSLDDFERHLEKKYYREFSNLPSFVRSRWHKVVAKSPDTEEEASEIHAAMKVFVAISKWKKSGMKEEEFDNLVEFETEKEKADVRIGNEFFEGETLFGRDSRAELMRKIEEKKQDNFVLRNISVLFHLKDLQRIKKDWKRRNRDINIYCLDLGNEELIEIGSKKFKEKIKGIGLLKEG